MHSFVDYLANKRRSKIEEEQAKVHDSTILCLVRLAQKTDPDFRLEVR